MNAARAIAALALAASVLFASCGGGETETARKTDQTPEDRAPESNDPKQTPRKVGPGKQPPQHNARVITNSIGMKLTLIQPGSFLMGSTKGGATANRETPVHKVTLTRPFYLGVYEVTQEQYKKVVGENPSEFPGPKRPVDNVSFYKAREFCEILSQKEDADYRMPTEAEWEYACRAGTATEYPFGDSPDKLAEYAWFAKNSGKQTHPVGRKKPSPWGLYDMHGNVWEWCDEKYAEYLQGEQVDPFSNAYSRNRVLRGGSWRSDARECRSAFRGSDKSKSRRNRYGFRVVREIPTPKPRP